MEKVRIKLSALWCSSSLHKLASGSKICSNMDWNHHRAQMDAAFSLKSLLLILTLLLVLTMSMCPGLRSMGLYLHSALTGSYVPGHYSVLLLNSPTKEAAHDISRAIMERRLAASINILSRTSTMYYWKGEIQDANEILMLVRTKTSRIQQVIDHVSVEIVHQCSTLIVKLKEKALQGGRCTVQRKRSFHPYANPEVLSFPVEHGSLAYMKWIDEAVPDD